jgi:hypothetical protein
VICVSNSSRGSSPSMRSCQYLLIPAIGGSPRLEPASGKGNEEGSTLRHFLGHIDVEQGQNPDQQNGGGTRGTSRHQLRVKGHQT